MLYAHEKLHSAPSFGPFEYLPQFLSKLNTEIKDDIAWLGKGVKMSRGEYLLFVNTDELSKYYSDPTLLLKLAVIKL